MPTKKILFLGHSASSGGAEYCLDMLLRRLDHQKYKATVLFPWEGPMADSARSLGLNVEIWPLKWWMCWERSRWYFKSLLFGTAPTIFKLAQYIQDKGFDLVYSNSAVIFEAAFAAKLVRVPHIWHVHEVLKPESVTNSVLPLSWIKSIIRSISTSIIFESNSSKRVCHNGTKSHNCKVIYNGVRLEQLERAQSHSLLRKQLGIAEDVMLVGFVGRFSARKDPQLLINAMQRLAKQASIRCVFVGDGPLKQEIERLISKHVLGERCWIIPFQTDISWVMEALDVLVLPSVYESFGLVLIEAAAFGKPVIATRTEGPSEIVVEGNTGYLIDPCDDEALAKRLLSLSRDASLRKTMGNNAKARIGSLFTVEHYTKQVFAEIDLQMSGVRSTVYDS